MALRYSEDTKRVLVYLFRPVQLQRDLSCGDAAGILLEAGYQTRRVGDCILHLITRLDACADFPHEIGLFLGYPPEDVRGFIEHKAKNFKCCGCWKVYGDEAQARVLFDRYQRCTNAYCAQWSKGVSLERLAAAV